MDVTVERASIALLLGDARRAAELLGLGGGGTGGGAAAAANPEVLAFVKVRRLPVWRRACRLGWECAG